MKKVLLLIFSIILLNASDLTYLSFVDFIRLLSHLTNKNVVLADNVDKNFHIFLPAPINQKNYKKLLYDVLAVNGLTWKNEGSIILIYRPVPKKKEQKLFYKVIKYKYLKKSDLDSILQTSSIKSYKIVKNRIIVYDTKEQIKRIQSVISLLDNSYNSAKIQVMVINVQNSKIKELGSKLKLSKEFPDVKAYFDIVTANSLYTTQLNQPVDLFAFIKMTSDKGYTNIVTNPIIKIVDSSNALIKSTTTIPYLVQTTTNKDAQTIVQNSYDYKDVGLKIDMKNISINDDFISMDILIEIQDILDRTLTPVTSNKVIQTHVDLKKGQTIAIGGIKSSSKYKNVSNIPIIENIPVISNLTKFQSTNYKDETFTIFLTAI